MKLWSELKGWEFSPESEGIDRVHEVAVPVINDIRSRIKEAQQKEDFIKAESITTILDEVHLIERSAVTEYIKIVERILFKAQLESEKALTEIIENFERNLQYKLSNAKSIKSSVGFRDAETDSDDSKKDRRDKKDKK